MAIWTAMSTKTFLSSLISMLKKTNDEYCHSKILFLIQKWAKKYEPHKELLPNYGELYTKLKKSNVEFSNETVITYQKYFKQPVKVNGIANDEEELSYVEMAKIKLNSIKFEEKNLKLFNYLATMIESVALGNEIIDNSSQDYELEASLQDIFDFLPKGKECLIEVVSSDKIKDELLIEFILGVIEDVNRTRNREEAIKLKVRPEKFMSFLLEGMKEKALKQSTISKGNINSFINRQSLIQSQMSFVNNANDFFDFDPHVVQVYSQPKQPQVQPQVLPQVQAIPQPMQQPMPNDQGISNEQVKINPINSISEDIFQILGPTQPVAKDPKLWEPIELLANQLQSAYFNNNNANANVNVNNPQQNYNLNQGQFQPSSSNSNSGYQGLQKQYPIQVKSQGIYPIINNNESMKQQQPVPMNYINPNPNQNQNQTNLLNWNDLKF